MIHSARRFARLSALLAGTLTQLACAAGELGQAEVDATLSPARDLGLAPPAPPEIPDAAWAPSTDALPLAADAAPRGAADAGPPPDAAPPVEPPPADPCAELGEGTACLGETLLICSARGAHEVDCAAQGWMCLIVGGQAACRAEPPPEEPPPPVDPPPGDPPPGGCDQLDRLGRCRGEVLEFCDQGAPQAVDCAAQGARCGFVDNNQGFACVAPPPDPGGGEDLSAVLLACSAEDPAFVAFSAIVLCALADDTEACIIACIAAALGV